MYSVIDTTLVLFSENMTFECFSTPCPRAVEVQLIESMAHSGKKLNWLPRTVSRHP